MNDNNYRLVTIDLVKGFAIILVVFGHCIRGLFDKNIISENSIYHYVDYLIYTFHMPIFFIISGMFFIKSLNKDTNDFWRIKTKTIIYPYFVWSIFQGAVQVVMSLNSVVLNHKLEINQLLSILWKPISPFWFLYALFFCNLICYFCIKKISLKKLIFVSAFLFLILVSFHFYVLSDIFYGMIYFLIGIYLSKINFISIKLIRPKWMVVLLFVFIAISMIGYQANLGPRLMFLNALIGAYAIYYLSKSIVNLPSYSLLVKHIEMLGKYSMSIFVMHILALGLARTILMEKFSVNDYLTLILTEMLFAIYLPVFVQDLALKSGVNNLMGLPFSAKNNSKITV